MTEFPRDLRCQLVYKGSTDAAKTISVKANILYCPLGEIKLFIIKVLQLHLSEAFHVIKFGHVPT